MNIYTESVRALLLMFVVSGDAITYPTEPLRKIRKDPNDPLIIEAAFFALSQLRKISESGIYDTLSLSYVTEAFVETAQFHHIIHMEMILTSPFFYSNKRAESFKVLHLQAIRQFNDKSIAIDILPKMQSEAIERAWIDMVRRRRATRRSLFAKWESGNK